MMIMMIMSLLPLHMYQNVELVWRWFMQADKKNSSNWEKKDLRG